MAEHEGFERFVAEDGDRLLHVAYGLCGDWQHAEDLVQQALIALARRWDRIATNPAGYAYRCLVRANVDRWRWARPSYLDLPSAGCWQLTASWPGHRDELALSYGP